MIDPPPAAGRGSGPLERVTVNLNARSSQALDQAVELTTDSKTDTINKALQIYAYLQSLMHSGGRVYIKEPDSDELERLRIF